MAANHKHRAATQETLLPADDSCSLEKPLRGQCPLGWADPRFTGRLRQAIAHPGAYRVSQVIACVTPWGVGALDANEASGPRPREPDLPKRRREDSMLCLAGRGGGRTLQAGCPSSQSFQTAHLEAAHWLRVTHEHVLLGLWSISPPTLELATNS